MSELASSATMFEYELAIEDAGIGLRASGELAPLAWAGTG